MSNGPRPVDPNASAGRVNVRSRSHSDENMLAIDERTKKAGMHYRWVRCRGDENAASVAKHRRRGYSIVTKEDGVRTLVEPDNRPDTAIGIGDMILMACPEPVYQRRVAERKAHTEAKMNSSVAVTKQMAKEKGVKIIDDSSDET